MNPATLFPALLEPGVLTPLFIDWSNIVIKSLVIICIPALILLLPKYRHSSLLKYSLWLQSLIGLALLPIVAAAVTLLDSSLLQSPALFFIAGLPTGEGFSRTASTSSIPVETLIFFLYIIPLSVLSLRMGLAYLKVRQISNRAVLSTSTQLNRQLKLVMSRLALHTPVQLKTSKEVSSPFCFGLNKPEIILPLDAKDWSASMLEDVLIHELSHIKRRDWLWMIVSHSIASVNWFNPLCWIAKARLNEEAENCCDMAVLDYGKSNTEYAENLISIAKQNNNASPMLVQTLVKKSKFHKRIQLILEDNMKILNNKPTRHFFTALLGTVVILGAGTQVLSADTKREEIYPVITPIPAYPSIAAEQNIEGWTLMQFDVLEDGNVDSNSIAIVDESPAGVFTQASASALELFRFSPRVDNGVAVTVHGVQYVFRYNLKE